MFDYRVIVFTGDNAADFLQGQLTADIGQLNDQNFLLTAYCNPQGRIWCIGRLWREGVHFYLLLPQQITTETAQDLQKYAALSRVKVEIKTDYHIIPTHTANLATLNLPAGIKILPINKQRALIIAPKELNVNTSAMEMTTNEWELAEIRDGIPNIWQQTLSALLPHDVNLPELNAVSFDKGCYKGQEIVARMQYRGQRKKHLYYAICPATYPVQPGDKIFIKEEKVGEIVSIALNNQNQYEFLAVLPDAIVEQNAELYVNNNPIPAAYVEIRLPHE